MTSEQARELEQRLMDMALETRALATVTARKGPDYENSATLFQGKANGIRAAITLLREYL